MTYLAICRGEIRAVRPKSSSCKSLFSKISPPYQTSISNKRNNPSVWIFFPYRNLLTGADSGKESAVWRLGEIVFWEGFDLASQSLCWAGPRTYEEGTAIFWGRFSLTDYPLFCIFNPSQSEFLSIIISMALSIMVPTPPMCLLSRKRLQVLGNFSKRI